MRLSSFLRIFHNKQDGHVFITALIILLLGTALLAPLLGFMGTGLKTGLAFEEETDLLYAADAGIEDAIWQIQNGGEGIILGKPGFYEDNEPVEGVEPVHGLPPYIMYEDEATTIVTSVYNQDGKLVKICDENGEPIKLFDGEGNSLSIFDIRYDEEDKWIDVYTKVDEALVPVQDIYFFHQDTSKKMTKFYDTAFYTIIDPSADTSLVDQDPPALPINRCKVTLKLTSVGGYAFIIESTATKIDENGQEEESEEEDENGQEDEENSTKVTAWVLAQDNTGAYNEDYLYIFDNAITTPGTVDLKNKVEVLGGVLSGTKPSGQGDYDDDWDEYDPSIYTWPDLDFLREFYYQQAAGGANYSGKLDAGISPGTYPLSGGVAEDGFNIRGTKTIKLEGTLFVNGDFQLGSDNMTINLGGNTMYATGNIDIKNGGGVTTEGFGCIIAEGDIIFRTNGDTDPDGFLLLMSLNGEIQVNNGDIIYGCITGDATVEMKNGCYLDATGLTPDELNNFNFPSGEVIEDATWEEVKLISWEVD